ncbi:MAG: HAMP domain-containing histidine kinase, partial [Deltaproteobacteria bacterium]|nr:HAMP domain-containing histidine kinase [Deltaproteobacteria bacterium]
GRREILDVAIEIGAAGARERFSVSAFPSPTGVGLVLTGAPRRPEEEGPADREALFHAILDHAAIGILAMEWGGGGLWVNPAIQRMLGYTHRELVDLGIQGITHPEDYPADLEQFQKLMAGQIDHYELVKRYLRKDGTIMWGQLVVSLARDAAGAPRLLIAMIEDVTARKRSDEERERAVHELEKAVHAREVFISVASHELRTPLTPLLLSLQTLSRKLAKAGAAPGEVDTAIRQTERLVRLVDDLLDASRLAGGRISLAAQRFDVVGLACEVIERHRSEAVRAGCELRLSAPPSLVIEADRGRVDQVFSNLLSNALKFGAGKSVEVAVEDRPDAARLTVADRGIGIPPEDLERIFLPFERAVSEMRYGGIGVGLFIARQLVEMHGGTIRAQSGPGAGATFTVDLPRNNARSTREAGRA